LLTSLCEVVGVRSGSSVGAVGSPGGLVGGPFAGAFNRSSRHRCSASLRSNDDIRPPAVP